MGLDTTHGCFHGAYSSFGRWRADVGTAAGYDMTFGDGGKSFSPDQIDQPIAASIEEVFTPDRLLGIWEEAPQDPLLVLLLHQDCEGYIIPRDQIPLANRLEELLDAIEDVDTTVRFIDGLRDAASRSEVIIFG